MALACGRTRFDGTSLCVAGRSGRGDANRHARESRARSTSESARRSLEGAGGFALASRCIGERHARHALPACTSTPTDQHAHGGGAGKSPKGFRPAGRRSLKRQVRAPIKKRRGVGATITSHALHSCAPAPFTAELLPPQMLYVHLYFGPAAFLVKHPADASDRRDLELKTIGKESQHVNSDMRRLLFLGQVFNQTAPSPSLEGVTRRRGDTRATS